MTIKSDKWIRRMAEAHGMIEPYEPRQVRHVATLLEGELHGPSGRTTAGLSAA